MTLPSIDAGRARDLIGRFAGLPVLIAGDVMLDRFIVGRVTRISPEAPVPVVRFESEHAAAGRRRQRRAQRRRARRPRGTGRHRRHGHPADQLRAQLAVAGVGVDGLVEDATRPTTEKVRVVTERNQQVARIDYERDADASGEVERALVAQVTRLAGGARALLVSDYLKGAITRAVVEALLHARSASGGSAKTSAERVPLIVDPKIPHLSWYAGATLVTPNHHEAETATHRRIRSDDDAQAAARDFRTRASCDAVLITRGEHGMWLSAAAAEGSIPARAREVSDVTGAGDTVVATLSLALAAGATTAEAAALANHAAGIVVGKFGPATLTAAELAASF